MELAAPKWLIGLIGLVIAIFILYFILNKIARDGFIGVGWFG